MATDTQFIVDRIKIGRNTFILERVKNVDDLLNAITDSEFNEDERLPYWAELWPSSLALTEFILTNDDIFRGKTLLELGCGIGLTTLALYKCNPVYFMATDYEHAALDSVVKNFELNNIYEKPQLQILDWRGPYPDNKFDIICASDIAYERRFFQPLIDLFEKLLLPGGEIILAEPNRKVAQNFFGKLALAGYNYSQTDKIINQNEKNITVSIYRIRKNL
jgi:predicted nicotinamide N-methyase